MITTSDPAGADARPPAAGQCCGRCSRRARPDRGDVGLRSSSPRRRASTGSATRSGRIGPNSAARRQRPNSSSWPTCGPSTTSVRGHWPRRPRSSTRRTSSSLPCSTTSPPSSRSDEKGQEIIPLWLDDYRAYVADRRVYADQLREGENQPFAESAVEGADHRVHQRRRPPERHAELPGTDRPADLRPGAGTRRSSRGRARLAPREACTLRVLSQRAMRPAVQPVDRRGHIALVTPTFDEAGRVGGVIPDCRRSWPDSGRPAS